MWEKVRLKDIVFGGGLLVDGDWVESKDQNPDGSVRLIQLADIGICDFLNKSNRFMTETKANDLRCTFLNKGDILIARMPDPIGRACIFPFQEGKFVTVVDVAILRVNTKIANSSFIMYMINSLGFRNQIDKYVSGTTRQRISKANLANFLIPLPPLPVQQRIADMLDKADALRRKDQELLKKYDELAQAIFIDMFGEYLNQNLTTLFDEIVINPSKKEVTINNDSKVSFIPMAHVGETGELNLTLSKSYEEVRTGFTYFRENDVLFAKITPCMENGKGAIARNLVRGIGFGSTEFHVLRPNEKIVAEFIYYWLSMPKVRKDAELNMTGSAGQKRVPVNFFSKLYFSVPPIELQRQFATRIEIINQLKAEANAEKSEELFQSLLQRVFKGQLTPV